MTRLKYWVGCSKGSRYAFGSRTTPTEKQYPQYKMVIGPFRTKRAATMIAESNYSIIAYSIDEAEKIAKSLHKK